MPTATNPHSVKRQAAVYMGGVTGISSAGVFDPTEFSAKTAPVAADKVVIQDTESGNAPKTATFANVAKLLNTVTNMVDDSKNSLFVTYGELDAGTTEAVDHKLTDALEAKGQLLFVLGVVNEVFDGTADSVIKISKAASGATPMASSITMDKGGAQVVGTVVGAWPVSGADSICASGGKVYAYVAGDYSRTTGKLGILLLWMKTA